MKKEEIRKGILETYASLISVLQNMPGMKVEEVFGNTTVKELKYEKSYLEKLFNKKNDFKINTKVYFVDIVQVPHFKECPLCFGEKHLLCSDYKKVECPECNGTGEISKSGGLKRSVNNGNLHKIVQTIDCGSSFEYYIDVCEQSDYVKVHQVFQTEKEALLECENKNKTGIVGYSSF